MKANELQIGDLIYVYGQDGDIYAEPHWYVRKVTDDWLVDMVRGEEEDRRIAERGINIKDGQLFIGDTKPIPITEEILKTNGFKEVYKSTFQTIYILQLPMGEDFLEYAFLACSDNCFKIFLYSEERGKTYINNVHQLQQSLRLCGLNDLADNFKV